VAFKTPLDSKYDDQIPIENRFNTEMLFSSMSNMKVKILHNTLYKVNSDIFLMKIQIVNVKIFFLVVVIFNLYIKLLRSSNQDLNY